MRLHISISSTPRDRSTRSLKRFLEDAGPQTQLDLGGVLVPLSELMAGLLILERGEIENTCTVVRSLIGKSATVLTSRSKSGARTALEAEGVEDEDS